MQTQRAKEITQEILLLPEKRSDPTSLKFCADLRTFLADCCALGQARNSRRLPFACAKDKKPSLKRRLDQICRSPLIWHDAENLRRRLIDPARDANRLFTFLDVHGMEPTNNHAEQSLRLPVIFRKICFGSRSPSGAATFSTNLSLLTTAKPQHRAPIQFLQTLLLSGPAAAQPLLYRNPLPDTS